MIDQHEMIFTLISHLSNPSLTSFPSSVFLFPGRPDDNRNTRSKVNMVAVLCPLPPAIYV